MDMENKPAMPQQPASSRKANARLARDAAVAAICGLVVALMVGASYAAVPVYNWLRRVSRAGFGPAGPQYPGALRCQGGGRAAVEGRGGAARDRRQNRRSRHRVLQ